MRRFLPFLIVSLFLLPSVSRGEEFYEKQLNSGIRDADAYSYMLIMQSRENKPEAIKILKKAALYSPDLPAVYFELAKANFSFSESGILNSVDYAIQGIDAYLRNFLWSFAFAASLYFSLLFSFALSFVFIVIIRLSSDTKMISHDVGEGNVPPFLLLVLVILALLGPFFFIAGILILLGIYMKKMDKTVVYIFLLFLVFFPMVLKQASLFISALSSGSLKAVVQVNTSKDNKYALSVLKNADGKAELFSYALALKREGRYDEAIALYKKLLQRSPDPRVYVNLGNCYVGLYDFGEDRKHYLNEAAGNYLAAINVKPLASAYYNLSQVSREMIDFSAGNEYFKSALSLDRVAVAEYSSFYARTPNRFVADETLTDGDLWNYAKARSGNVFTFGMTTIPLPFVTFAALLLILSFYMMNNKVKQKAYRCRKCNTILCTGCEKRMTWGQLCPQCYGSLVKLDELDVKERVARLLSIYEKQRRRKSTLKILSFLLPGSSQIYAGRVLFGFLFLWPFLFCILIPVASSIFITESTLFSHNLLKIVSLFFAAIIYVVSNFITRGRLSRGWL